MVRKHGKQLEHLINRYHEYFAYNNFNLYSKSTNEIVFKKLIIMDICLLNSLLRLNFKLY